MHRHVGFVRAVHAKHSEELPVRARVGPETHQRVRDRVAEQAGQLGELARPVAEDDAAPAVDHGTLGAEQEVRRPLDLLAVAFDGGIVGAHVDLPRVHVGHLDPRVRDVLGDVHDHRPRPSRGGQVEGALQRLGEVPHVLHEEVVLHARPRDADRVDLLEGVAADPGRRHLTGQDHQRNRVHEGRGDTGDGVRGARTGGDEGHARAPGRARVSVGGVRRALLVTDQHVLDGVLLVDLVVDVQYSPPGVPEDAFHALVLEELHDDLPATELHGSPPDGEQRHCRPQALGATIRQS